MKEAPVPIQQEAGGDPEQASTLWGIWLSYPSWESNHDSSGVMPTA
jgi:hypothetical protein